MLILGPLLRSWGYPTAIWMCIRVGGPSYGMSYPTPKWDDWDVPHLKTAITFVIIIITINICMIYIDVLLSLLLRDIASRKTMVVTMMVVIL